MVEGKIKEKQDEFVKQMHPAVKKMVYNGFVPHSKLWVITKIALMLNITDSLRISLQVEPEYNNILMMLQKHKWLRNYKIWYWINKIYTLKRYFKWYYKMDGLKLYIKPAPKMGEILMDYQLLDIWEPETTKIVKENVKEGDTCIDIGASVGYFTLQFARLVGALGTVLAVEPTDFQQPYLKKNIKINGFKDRVEVYNVGAWNKTEKVMMPLNAPPYVQTTAPCVAVDDIVRGRKVDFIKLDIDGAEPKALRGLEKTFQNNPQLKMVAEYYPKYIKNAGLDPAEYREIIDKYFEFTIIPGDYTEGCWNLFCVRRRENSEVKNNWPDKL